MVTVPPFLPCFNATLVPRLCCRRFSTSFTSALSAWFLRLDRFLPRQFSDQLLGLANTQREIDHSLHCGGLRLLRGQCQQCARVTFGEFAIHQSLLDHIRQDRANARCWSQPRGFCQHASQPLHAKVQIPPQVDDRLRLLPVEFKSARWTFSINAISSIS